MIRVDLHTHSTASDGEVAPDQLVLRAAKAGLQAIALTDHDTLEGVTKARDAGVAVAVDVISGCEFSVSVWWGEMHLLGYGLPIDDAELSAFLSVQRQRRVTRAETIVDLLNGVGVGLSLEDVMRQSDGAAVGRPHVARALVGAGFVPDVATAFDRYIGRGCPAFVSKDLPPLREVAALVVRAGGVTSAAHLGRRGTRSTLARLRDEGVDGVEARHPSHDPILAAKIERIAGDVGLILTGGSDWHGDHSGHHEGRGLGGVDVPGEWLETLEQLVATRTTEQRA